MGNIATVTINHDLLSVIEKDKEFGAKLARAIRRQSIGPELIDHYAYVVEWHHNTFNVMVKVGGHVGEEIRELLPLSLQPQRLTKKKAIELLGMLAPKLDSMFSGYSGQLLIKVIAMMKKEED